MDGGLVISTSHFSHGFPRYASHHPSEKQAFQKKWCPNFFQGGTYPGIQFSHLSAMIFFLIFFKKGLMDGSGSGSKVICPWFHLPMPMAGDTNSCCPAAGPALTVGV